MKNSARLGETSVARSGEAIGGGLSGPDRGSRPRASKATGREGSFHPRRMANGIELLAYHLYLDPAATQI